jgi:hypothetical protein
MPAVPRRTVTHALSLPGRAVIRPRLAVAAILGCAALAACSGDLQFTNDHRLAFTDPANHAKVTEPITVTWSMKDFEVVGKDGGTGKDRGFFAVFVDKPPIKVGKSLKSIVDKTDRSCAKDPACPSEQYLKDRNIYLTSTTSVVIERFPKLTNKRSRQDHDVTVILLDGTGRRIGESAWSRTFEVRKANHS